MSPDNSGRAEYVDSLLCGLAALEAYRTGNAAHLHGLVTTTEPWDLFESVLRVAGLYNALFAAQQDTTTAASVSDLRDRLVAGLQDMGSGSSG